MYHFDFKNWKGTEKCTAALAVLLAALTVLLRAVPGVSFSASLCLLGSAVCLALLWLSRMRRRHRVWKWLLRLAQVGLAVLILGLSALEVWIVRTGEMSESGQSVDAVIVLGAGVNGSTPSVALQTRIDAAAEYLAAHPGIPVVLSGGQEPGEHISEAQAMFNALTAQGIAPERLILEEASTNTRENLENSLALLPDASSSSIAVVTNDFHMARVQLLLRACGADAAEQVPARLPWWWLSANYYVRETFAIVKDMVLTPLTA